MIDRPVIPKVAGAVGKPPPHGMRSVYFTGAVHDTPIYDRATLPAGFRIDGPAVVEEFGSTTVVFPGHRLEVDERGILIVQRRAEIEAKQ